MPRLTRAQAAQVAEELHVDEDVLLEMHGNDSGALDLIDNTLSKSTTSRKPLGEITPNSGGNKSDGEQSSTPDEDEQRQTLHKSSTRSKKGGRKATKQKNTTSGATSPVSTPESSEDAQESISGGGREAEHSILSTTVSSQDKVEHMQNQETTSTTPPTALGRSTRSRKAKQPETSAQPQAEEKHSAEQKEYFQQILDAPVVEGTSYSPSNETPGLLEANARPTSMSVLDAPASPLPSAIPNVVNKLRNEAASNRSTSNKENMDPIETSPPTTPLNATELHDVRPTNTAVSDLPSEIATISLTPAAPSTYDDLETAAIEAATPSSTPRRTSTMSSNNAIEAMDALEDAVDKINAELPNVVALSQGLKTKKKEAPIVRMTKGAQARISMAHGTVKATPSWGPPRQSTLGRVHRVRDPAANNKSADAGGIGKKEVVIPHSKPRPMSMSFPAPKLQVKSSKPPTKSTFQLPGEAVAAKLKAAKEERTGKETDGKKTFKARPVPSSMKVAPFVRENNASKFRQSLMTSKTSQPAGHRRANSVAPTQPRPAAKTVPASSTNNKLGSSTLMVNKRPSTAMANMNRVRTASDSSGTTGTTAQRVPSKGTTKGKEVFNRAAAAKEAQEKEKREKEEATKQARAAAAERSRQASREWAKKQEMRKLGSKACAGSDAAQPTQVA